jgi:hypothetical protein
VSFWGWESARKAGKIHLYLEVAGLIFLALLVFCEALEERNTTLSQAFKRAGTCSLGALVVAEIARLMYGHRADKLSESEHVRLESEVRALRTESNEASRLLADRRVSAEQRTKLIEILSSRKGETIYIDSLLSSGREGLLFANDIAAAFKQSGWNLTEAPSGQYLLDAGMPPARGAIVLSPVWSPTTRTLDSSFTTLGTFIQASFVSARIRISADPDMPMLWAPTTSERAVMILVLEK